MSAVTAVCNSILRLVPPTCRWYCILKILRIILCLFYIYFKTTPKLFVLCLVKIIRFSLSISPSLIPLSFVTVSSYVHSRYSKKFQPPPPPQPFIPSNLHLHCPDVLRPFLPYTAISTQYYTNEYTSISFINLKLV